jgi:hypothetical protein
VLRLILPPPRRTTFPSSYTTLPFPHQPLTPHIQYHIHLVLPYNGSILCAAIVRTPLHHLYTAFVHAVAMSAGNNTPGAGAADAISKNKVSIIAEPSTPPRAAQGTHDLVPGAPHRENNGR